MDSEANKNGGDGNLGLFGQMKKGKGKWPSRSKGKSEELASQWDKKYLSKNECFICHKFKHYASQCLDKRKGKGKQQHKQAVAFAEN